MDGGVTPTRHWGTPTRARGSPTKLINADGTARGHEAFSARKAASHALIAARHMCPVPRHQSCPARHESPPARRAVLPAQQLVLPARRARPGFESGRARVWGSGGLQGALQARQRATGKASGGQGVRAWPSAEWQDRLVGSPLGELKQTDGGAVGRGKEGDQVWSRYLERAKEKQGLQAGSAASSTAVINSNQVCFATAICA